MKKTITAISALALASATWAANLASDDASDPAYSGGVWTNGSNGGFGFGPWQLITSGSDSGHYIGDSTNNGDGTDDGNINGTASDSDINTGTFRPVAWGMYAGVGLNSAQATRSFTGGALDYGQTFAINFDNGFIEFDGFIDLALLDAFSTPVLQVAFLGGGAQYFFADAGGGGLTGLDFGTEGLRLEVTMTGVTNYTATLTHFSFTNSVTWSGTMTAAPEAFRATIADAGGVGPGQAFNLYINSMEIVPEPSTIALGAIGVAGVALRALRRRNSPHVVGMQRVG
jgi:hypothetical protein